MRKITFYLFILLCLLLTACGDGGGGSDDPSGGGNGNGGGNGGSEEAVIPASDDYLCFTANVDGCSISTTVGFSLTTTPTLEYSTDKENWIPFIINSTSVDLPNTDDKVYIRAISANATFSEEGGWIQFVISGSVSASGNIMSLLEKYCRVLSAPAWAFRYLFKNTTITTAPKLPATTLARFCYGDMFYGCSSLSTAPELPATTLADFCYTSMFEGCSLLTTAPDLPATTLADFCYTSMFSGCGLNSITVNFTTWNNATYNWLYDVNDTGTFTCPVGLPEEYGYSRIPTGWTVQHPSTP